MQEYEALHNESDNVWSNQESGESDESNDSDMPDLIDPTD